MAIRNNPFKPIIKKIPAPMRNIYFLTLVLFFFWMIFIDRHDVLTQWKLQKTLDNLENEEDFYREKIGEVKKDIQDNKSNKEKFAREHYYLKKDNEDVFIITEKKEE